MENQQIASHPGFADWKKSRLLNVWIDSLTLPEFIERLDAGVIYTVNPDHYYHLQRNPDFAAAYADATYVTADSTYVYWCLGLLGRRVKSRVTGSELVPAYWRHHAKNPAVRIFLLGAKPGVAQLARERINAEAGREIVVGAHGPSFNFVNDEAEAAEVIEMIRQSGATCLVVGLGAPKQEVWIHRHRHLLPEIKVFMGVGATIDYEAGVSKRAPAWMSRIGLEWSHRVLTEPRRYLWRYVRTLEFFWLTAADWLGLYRPPPFPSPATMEPSQEMRS